MKRLNPEFELGLVIRYGNRSVLNELEEVDHFISCRKKQVPLFDTYKENFERVKRHLNRGIATKSILPIDIFSNLLS